jgi:hypothetical protein
MVSCEPLNREWIVGYSEVGRIRIAPSNKLGLYRQCAGAGKAGIVAKRVRRRIADTACCTEPAYGDSIVSLCVERG